jgi:predicted acyl esterase
MAGHGSAVHRGPPRRAQLRHAALTEPVRISGAPVVNLVASTSGTDADWVVKLIDVYPDEMPSQPELGGYQLGIAMDIFRGRYRESFENPHSIEPVHRCRTSSPCRRRTTCSCRATASWCRSKSSWFPLYDRNPQTFVPNIFFAKAQDYVKATVRIYHAADAASFVSLPIVTTK